jgi:hypothetical protein
VSLFPFAENRERLPAGEAGKLRELYLNLCEKNKKTSPAGLPLTKDAFFASL